jgi:hypothetical protein
MLQKDYGMAHFVMIDTETDLGKGIKGPDEFAGSQFLDNGPFGRENQQIEFLEADLASVDRTVTRMFVFSTTKYEICNKSSFKRGLLLLVTGRELCIALMGQQAE